MKIELNGINDSLLTGIIAKYSSQISKLKNMLGRFALDKKHIPIYNRKFVIDGVEQLDLVNHPAHIDFVGNIVNTKIGYLFGNPLDVVIEDKTSQQFIYDFMQRVYFDDVIAEIGTQAAVCGIGAGLLYLNKDGQADITAISPENIIFIGENILNLDLAIRFYSAEEIVNDKFVTYDYAECYDKTHYKVLRIKHEKNNQTWEMFQEETLHGFNDIPIILFKNNDLMQGDCENCLDSMDAYDRVFTDEVCDIEQYRMDYLVIKGDLGENAAEETRKLKRMRVMYLKNDSDGKNTQDAYFITRLLPIEKIDATLNRIKKEIYEMSRHLNVSDDSMGGQASGVALKNKQAPFEYKCLEAEREFKASLVKMFKVLCEFWAMSRQANIDYTKIDFIFTRNYAQNKVEEADVLLKLASVLPLEKAIELSSFDLDIKEVMELIEDKKNDEAEKLKNEMLRMEKEQDETVEE